MKTDLTGRRALVSGSTQGIGLAIATELARSGAAVVINGRDQAKTERAANTIRQEVQDAEVTAVAADLASAAGADKMKAKVGELDILVNNLGIYGAKPVFEIDDDEWRRYFEVNVLSAVRLIRYYLPGMMERGFGRVLSIASESAVATPLHMVHLGVTKTALLAVTRGFAKAAAGTGVIVNSVLAGPTRGPGSEELDDPNSLIQRLVEPSEIGNLIVYLSSTQASATTGGAIRVDGGYIDSILP
ncbi:SDR family oxidoreductase [Kribbella sp. NPDC051718]|uniref:SDR family NAD(P)-dependent oxidoreductase n=1 Tax=Kribbella sp. NPDC051718 TaxID=3155168 RepID=UPI00342E9D89